MSSTRALSGHAALTTLPFFSGVPCPIRASANICYLGQRIQNMDTEINNF